MGVTVGLSGSFTVMITFPSCGRSIPALACALANAIPKLSSKPIASPVDRISGPSSGSTSGSLLKGNTDSFTATPPTGISSGSPKSASFSPTISRAAMRASCTPVALLTKGTVRDARGFTSITYTCPSNTAYCTLIRPITPSASAKRRVCSRITSICRSRQPVRREDAGAVARVDAGLLDVLHHPADHHCLAVAQRVHVGLEGVFQEAVDQHRPVVRDGDGAAEVVAQARLVVHDLHPPPAKDVGGTEEDGVADALRDGRRLVGADRQSVGRLGDAQLAGERLEALAVFRAVDGLHRGADDRHAQLRQRLRQLERRLPAELDDHAHRLLEADDLDYVFQRERLEVELVAYVEVGRVGLGVGVDHDGLVPRVAQRQRGLHAAVVELHPLPDADGPAPQDHHLLALGADRLVLLRIRRVEVRGRCRELTGAGVHPIVDRVDPHLPPPLAHRVLGFAAEPRELHVAETPALHPQQVVLADLRQPRVPLLAVDQGLRAGR